MTNFMELPELPAHLPGRLLPWFREHARDLPWRRTTDPYPIWVSEIMLQQTRVAAVLGYYARFLAAFPTVGALADAPEEQLMKQWEGLGYYSRARNLQKAAREIVALGAFPDSYRGLLALPGIGDYTASAIASAAFGLREAAVDGNALRVVTRLLDCHDDILSPKTKQAVRSRLQAVMPQEAADIRIFNQAVMELGATVCAPNGPPACDRCPLRGDCLARQHGTAEILPVKAAKKARRREEKTVFLFLRDGQVALRRRPDTGLLAGLWEFPNVPGLLDERAAAQVVDHWGMTPRHWQKCLSARHIFTHVEWNMRCYSLEVECEGGMFHWMDLPEMDACALPSAFARCTREAREALKKTEETA